MASVVFFNVSHNIGGAEISLLELCRYLKHDISVICPQGSILEARIKQEHIKTGAIKVPLLKGGSGLFSKLTNYTYARNTRKELEKLLARHSWDIFISNNLMADFFAGDVPKKYCRKSICYCRDNPSKDAKASFLRKRDLVIAPSEFIDGQLEREGIKKKVRILNGVDIGYFLQTPDRESGRTALNLPVDPIIIGFAGQLIRRKGFMTFIECAEKIAEEHHNVAFAIAGGDLYAGSPFVREVQNRISSSPIRGRLIDVGSLEDMRPFYGAMDLYVALSKDEPFGRTLLESALCGTIPVASREGGHVEILGDFPELLVNPDNVDEVVTCINEFLSERGDKERLRTDVNAHAKSFSIEKTAKLLEEAYSGLLA